MAQRKQGTGNTRKTESARAGQKIRSETSPDKSSHQVNQNEALMGRTNKGGPKDLSHSISGSSTTNNYQSKGR